jgi:phosphoserine phosphatase RsbU/P
MRLRTRFLLIFLAAALLPLMVAAIYTQVQIHRLGTDLASISRKRLENDAKADLARTLDQFTNILSARRLSAELLVSMQASEIERLLVMVPGEHRRVFTDADYDRRDPAITDLRPSSLHTTRSADGTTRPVLVSETESVFRPPPGADLAAVEASAQRLTLAATRFASIRQRASGLAYWQYAGFVSGMHVSYPGHGGYPAGYDPRERAWYRRALERNGVAWTPPSVDATTRLITLAVAEPIHDPDGQILGVTGIDVPLDALVSDVDLAKRWGDEAALNVLQLRQAGDRPVILTGRGYAGFGSSWQDKVDLQTLTADDPADVASVAGALRAGESLMKTVHVAGRQELWAAKPGGQGDMAVLIRAPYEQIVAPAVDLERQFLAMTDRHRTTTIMLSGILLVMLAASVAVLADSLSRRIRQVAAASRKVADGSLETSVPERGKDEIAELAHSFNIMIPQLRNRIDMMHSLNLAMQIQQSLLPAGPPHVDGLDIAGSSVYCDQTGGDYYDFLSVERLGPGQMVVAVGDVAGHGIAAAILMATARAILRSRIEQPGSLAQVFTDMNRHMNNERTPGRFMTMFCLSINTQTRTLVWSSAGHDPILAYDPGADEFYELSGEDVPLGIHKDWQFHERSRAGWRPGTVLVVGTDGIWETTNAAGEFFGKEPLMALVRQNARRSAEEISEAITQQVREFRGGQPQEDDVTLVVVRLLK